MENKHKIASSDSHWCRPAVVCHYGNAVIITLLALYFFVIPFVIVSFSLTDPGLKGDGIPQFAFRVHRQLSPKYEKWARKRVASEQAEDMNIEDISGTEWPLFGSVFYLWATEALQEAWDKDKSCSRLAPNVYAKEAIEAATALVVDPSHAAWVKKHWGSEYLHRENVFYRMLIISAMTSYQKLLGKEEYMPLLRDQVETFSKELDVSPYGLLDDYPEQCYPTDVVAAIAAIKHADEVLGTDHSDFVRRSLRGFTGNLVDYTGLPPYSADARRGLVGQARGCSSQWLVMWAPQLWPETAKEWYSNFEEHFWQEWPLLVGFREFPKDTTQWDWHGDIDSGPVIAGFGPAASAFGIGAARANGRFDHAYPLGAELIALSWPLPNGTISIPRLLSNMSDAPYLGEASVLFSLTRTPAEGVQITKAGKLPYCVYLAMIFYLGVGSLFVLATVLGIRRWKKRISKEPIFLGKIQLVLWGILVVSGFAFGMFGNLPLGIPLLLLAQLLPRFEKKFVKQATQATGQE
ncbi:MAG: hypothetical protein ACYS32_14195 [Planctomycetota bacterium]|jgi:hypothetical protein